MHLGTHLLLDLSGCDRERLNDREGIRGCLIEAAGRCGATIISDHFHRFSPHGVSGVVIIAESHITIHTWPEYGFAAIDIFTCGDLSANSALAYIREQLGSQHETVRSIARIVHRPLPEESKPSPMSSSFRCAHTESVGPGRALRLAMSGDWLVDEVEQLEALEGMRQRVQIGDFVEFGRGLVMDGWVQIAEQCDLLYTSALIFPAALLARSRQRWLIVGGGDGPAAREALRFRDTESVCLVDISKQVTAFTQEHIPSFWAGCQHDPRLQIVHRDAWSVLREWVQADDKSDLIVFDLTDAEDDGVTPFTTSSADHLYSEESFRMVAQCLRPGGVFVVQVAELSDLRYQRHRHYKQLLQKLFRHVHSYRVYIDFFGYFESFLVAYQHDGPSDPAADLNVDQLLAELYRGDAGAFYGTAWHRSLFTLPPTLERALR